MHLLFWQDVDSFPDHIACDGDSKSEIVVPIRVGEKVTYTRVLPLGFRLSYAYLPSR